jgi:hypothetical protein
VTKRINEYGCGGDTQVAEILETQLYSNTSLNHMVKNQSEKNSVLTKTLRTENNKVVAQDRSDKKEADRVYMREQIRGNLQRLKYSADCTIPSGIRNNKVLYNRQG